MQSFCADFKSSFAFLKEKIMNFFTSKLVLCIFWPLIMILSIQAYALIGILVFDRSSTFLTRPLPGKFLFCVGKLTVPTMLRKQQQQQKSARWKMNLVVYSELWAKKLICNHTQLRYLKASSDEVYTDYRIRDFLLWHIRGKTLTTEASMHTLNCNPRTFSNDAVLL